MEQNKLEARVREIFEDQGFELEKKKNCFVATRENLELDLKVFSSEKFEKDEIEDLVEEGDRLFVDDELSPIDELENQVSVIREEEKEQFDLPSFEMIGDIAIISELPEMTREEAVEGILHHQNVKTILLKKEPLRGEYRIGEYEKLYGDETETVHKEFGCRFKVDPTKVYFSERFGTERKRVIDQVQEGEKVLVIGAGVGPFPILAAKHSDPEKVVAIEKNPVAVEYLRQNIEMNSVEDRVEVLEGDAREAVPRLDEMFDRVIIPIPEFGEEFLEIAMEKVKYNGVIQYYRFIEKGNWEEIEGEVREATDNLEKDFRILERVECGDRGPSVKRSCVDIRSL